MGEDRIRSIWVPETDDDRAAVRTELEEILSSEHFRSSGRYPALLRHIVEKALHGDAADLKERTIGIEVFHRKSDYNTADDPVVRVCGSEVRRRIAQFYQHAEGPRLVEIELPPGGYVPQFWHVLPEGHESQITDRAGVATPSRREGAEAEDAALGSGTAKAEGKRVHWRWILPFGAGVLAAVLIGAVFLLIQRTHEENDPMMQVWGPLLSNPSPVLISVGRPHPSPGVEPPPAPDLSVSDRILRPSYRVSITAVSAISDVAGFLETQKKPFRLHESDSSELDDLHKRPVVLINGNDNKWTMLLLKPLRFQLASDSDQTGTYTFITDAQHPGRRDWQLNWTQPYLKQTTDYAIVGRFYSSTTESPVVVIAGISSNGTEAGGEFMASPEALAALARDAHSSLDKNFEAVLRVEVVAGNTGGVKVVDSQFW